MALAVVANIAVVPALIGYGAANLDEAKYASDFLAGPQGLNSVANIAAEAQSTPIRRQLTSVHTLLPDYFPNDHESGLFCRLIVEDLAESQYCFGVQLGLSYLLYHKFEDYLNMSPWEDPAHWATIVTHAVLWYNAYDEVRCFDHTWCGLIGGVQNGYCTPTDGLIPASVSTWPGATVVLNLGNISHRNQPDQDFTWTKVALGLKAAGVPLRGGGGSNALTVGQVQGPDVVDNGGSDSFSISASSGQGTLSYTWQVDGSVQQTGSAAQFTYTNNGNNYIVSVLVSDGVNSYTRTKSVTVGSCGVLYCQ